MADTKFAERLVELRKKAGMTQAELAAKADIPLGSLRDLEQGRRKPNWDRVQDLARALGVRCTEFETRPKRK